MPTNFWNTDLLAKPGYIHPTQATREELHAALISSQLREKALLSFVEDVAANWDCDEDAHRYQTACRACLAKRLLETLRTDTFEADALLARVKELETMNANQKCMLDGHHKYVGQDFQFRLNKALRELEVRELRVKELEEAIPTIMKLIAVTRAAFYAADDSLELEGEYGREYRITAHNFDSLSSALDALDELPDDKPDYCLSGPARAEWALRNLLDPNTSGAVPTLTKQLAAARAVIEEADKVLCGRNLLTADWFNARDKALARIHEWKESGK